MSQEENRMPGLSRLQGIGIVLAVLGGVLTIAGLLATRAIFFQSYLFGFIFWMNLTLGLFGLSVLHHSTRARWSLGVVRLWEAGARLIPLMAVLGLPLVVAVLTGQLYLWATPEAHHVVNVAHKGAYLNPAFFTVRYVLYFALWWFFASRLYTSSVRQDRTGDTRESDRRASWAAAAIPVFVITVTLASTDWVMSLDREWHSTVFGLWFVISQSLVATAFSTLVIISLRRFRPFSETLNPQLRRDLGNLLLTNVMFWAYLALSQWLIIYSGNLPDEITYYITRLNGFWWTLGTIVVVFQFFVPFVLLLSGRTKRTPGYLGIVCAWLLLMRVLDIAWTVLPFFTQTPERAALGMGGLHWLDAGPLLAIGGIWLLFYVGALKRHALLPAHVAATENAQEAMSHA